MAYSNTPNATRKRRKYALRKQLFLEKLGGKCIKCGSVDNLEFDHVDRATMSFRILDGSGGLNKPVHDVLSELKKCQLLCENCHMDKTLEERGQLRAYHGGVSMYVNHGCRCDDCRKAWNTYLLPRLRKYRLQKKV